MGKRCEWLGHRWVDDGPASIAADLMTQPQKCAVCDKTKGHVGSWSDDPPPKIAKLWPLLCFAVLFATSAFILKMFSRG